MNRIINLNIKNYKKFSNERFSFSKKNVFLGDNDSGKTTIFDALNLFFNPKKIDLTKVRNLNEDVAFKVTADIDGELISYELIFDKEKDFKPPTASALKKIDEWVKIINSFNLLVFSANPANPTKDLIENIRVLLMDQIHDTVYGMITTAVESVESKMKSFISDIESSEAVINKDLTKLVANVQPVENFIDVKITSEDGTINPNSRGLGYLKTLSISLTDYESNGTNILLVDEIDNSMSEKNVLTFFSNIDKQIIATAHNINIFRDISALDDSKSIFLDRDNSDFSKEIVKGLEHRKILLTEGVTDSTIIKRKINDISDEFIVVEVHGETNMGNIIRSITDSGYDKVFGLKDGDSPDSNSRIYNLSRKFIEQYYDLNFVNKTLKRDFKTYEDIDNLENWEKAILRERITSDKIDNLLEEEIKKIG